MITIVSDTTGREDAERAGAGAAGGTGYAALALDAKSAWYRVLISI